MAHQIETAQFFPPSAVGELTDELVCYARSVAGVQWERMESGTLREQVNPWGGRAVPDAAYGRTPNGDRAVRL